MHHVEAGANCLRRRTSLLLPGFLDYYLVPGHTHFGLTKHPNLGLYEVVIKSVIVAPGAVPRAILV